MSRTIKESGGAMIAELSTQLSEVHSLESRWVKRMEHLGDIQVSKVLVAFAKLMP